MSFNNDLYSDIEDLDPGLPVESTKEIIPRVLREIRFRHTGGYVYVLQLGPDYKIGRTHNPSSRIKWIAEFYESVRPILPYKINPIIVFLTTNMYATEERLHREYEEKRLNGEWFRLNEYDIQEIINKYSKHSVEVEYEMVQA